MATILIICSDSLDYNARDSKLKTVSQSAGLWQNKSFFTQEVDYALVVSCKQSNCIFEQKHEGCIDYTIC